jgi:DNA-binding beta-propeller fold protein YncE/mono/diheme cytochrome c family protein
MSRPMRTITVLSLATLCVTLGAVDARSKSVARFDDFGGNNLPQVGFQMIDPSLGATAAPSKAATASLAGSSIAAISDGAVVLDEDSGKLLRTDRDGARVAELDVGRQSAQLVVDRKHERVFVADRLHDRVLVVSLRNGSLEQTDAMRTGAEPFGLALSPDGKTLLVTQVADQRLTALDTTTGFEKWSLDLGPEPRGVAISPEGDEALVTFLTTGVVGKVALGSDSPSLSFVSMDPAFVASPNPQPIAVQNQRGAAGQPSLVAAFNRDRGKSFVRNAFAAAYVGNGLAIVPHQLSTPHLDTGEFEGQSGGYGGGNGFTAPITHRLAFLDTPEQGEERGTRVAMATTNLHQPRAVAYDGRSDTLYVAGYGSDDVVAVADVSQSSVHLGWQQSVASNGACAPDGLAVDDASGDVLVFCTLTRTVVRLAGDPDSSAAPKVSHGPELASSSLSAAERRGKQMFRQGKNPMISSFGAMACASCHAEGRSDGLTWFLQGNILQTPFLAGRLVGTHPFKWDGQDANLNVSLTSTVRRLGGTGISSSDADDLQAYLTGLDKPRTPSVDDTSAVARGKKLFESETTGCLTCHGGAMSTDRKEHDLAPDLPAVDTPSLIGLAHSAPYYHDGSATSLDALLRDNGNIHSMGKTSRLADDQIADLVAYLETL